MATDIEICNLALSHLGIGKEIASFTEKSQEAQACNRFFDETRDTVMRSLAWPFATKFVTLGLVEEDPTSEWGFSYRYPSDCFTARRIFSGDRNDSPQTRVPYKLGNDDQGTLIYTDQEDAELEYTVLVDDPQLWPADFRMALSFLLAVYMAPRLAAGDPFKLGERAATLYGRTMAAASANAYNEQQDEQPPDAEMIRER